MKKDMFDNQRSIIVKEWRRRELELKEGGPGSGRRPGGGRGTLPQNPSSWAKGGSKFIAQNVRNINRKHLAYSGSQVLKGADPNYKKTLAQGGYSQVGKDGTYYVALRARLGAAKAKTAKAKKILRGVSAKAISLNKSLPDEK